MGEIPGDALDRDPRRADATLYFEEAVEGGDGIVVGLEHRSDHPRAPLRVPVEGGGGGGPEHRLGVGASRVELHQEANQHAAWLALHDGRVWLPGPGAGGHPAITAHVTMAELTLVQ